MKRVFTKLNGLTEYSPNLTDRGKKQYVV